MPNSSSKSASVSTAEKVIYHDKAKHGKHFCLFANPGLVEKWRKDKSVPLVEVLQSDDIFEGNGGGNQLGKASHLDIENAFETKDADYVRTYILEHGVIQTVGQRERAGSKNHGQGKGFAH